MARNKKTPKKGEGRKFFVSVQLDRETKKIWNLLVKRINMSNWIRDQLKYHFSNTLTETVKKSILKEEIFILSKKRDSKIEEIYKSFNNDIIERKKVLEELKVEYEQH